MQDKVERYEEHISILKEDLKKCKEYIVKYKKKIQELEDYVQSQHDSYVASLELGRQRVKESNNRLYNFDQLFQKLGRDMRYLNETTDLVKFSEESQVVMDTKMHVIEVNTLIDADDFDEDEDFDED